MESNKKVYMSAILYSIIVGLSFLFGKIALNSVDPIELLAYRFTASFIAVLIPILFKWIKVDLSKDKIKKILPLALFYPLMFFGFQAYGLKYASSSETGILQGAIPIFTLIIASYCLKERTNIYQKLSILLSVSGIIYITIMKSTSIEFTSLKGIILILLSCISFSCYSVLARILTKDFSNMELSAVMTIISFIVFNTFSIIKHLMNGTLGALFTPLKNINFILSILYLGVLSSLVTSILTNYILSKIEASKMSVFVNIAPIISIIAGAIILGEKIYYYHIIGSILIIIGVLGTNFLDKNIGRNRGVKGKP